MAIWNSWTGQETADLLIAFIRKHGVDSKLFDHPDYLERTIDRALNDIEKQKESRVSDIHEERARREIKTSQNERLRWDYVEPGIPEFQYHLVLLTHSDR